MKVKTTKVKAIDSLNKRILFEGSKDRRSNLFYNPGVPIVDKKKRCEMFVSTINELED